MNANEVIDLLTLMASYDRRTVGKSDVAAWGLAVGDLPFADSRDAVITHYRESREWIMPADVRDLVNEVRRERLKNAPALDPPHEVADDPAKYVEWLAAERKKIADGPQALKAVTS